MNQPLESWAEIEPKTLARECGGWLAVSPSRAAFQIGVTGQSEAEVIEKFRLAKSRWAEILLLKAS